MPTKIFDYDAWRARYVPYDYERWKSQLRRRMETDVESPCECTAGELIKYCPYDNYPRIVGLWEKRYGDRSEYRRGPRVNGRFTDPIPEFEPLDADSKATIRWVNVELTPSAAEYRARCWNCDCEEKGVAYNTGFVEGEELGLDVYITDGKRAAYFQIPHDRVHREWLELIDNGAIICM